MTFQQHFDALDVTTRAALVFRYREGLPLSHVAQLVDRPARKLGPHLERSLSSLSDAGALTGAGALDEAEDAQDALRRRLEELRGDPALSSFSLVSAVRAERNRRGLLRGRVMGRFA
ncbi:hypothetical protein KGQ19_19675 [Catenulispora sp. NL8]|uniref:Uncharacterized protein n=1 Tax=Catenulispora pinistramenti TaxID=2705254 RepID=A0ABS5KSS0_9ACTN|nr:hypothetical protein [Catenulispora pinistramenti]MBS2549088.1 hypothetical protein [Catenulispora pinistramenti]